MMKRRRLWKHCAGAIVNLKSRIASGQYRVCSGEHRFSAYETITKIKMY